MFIVDSILNVVAVLLWFHWCSLRFDPLAGTTARTLAGTLRRAEARKVPHWQTLGFLVALLLLRSWIYWQLGSASGWTARVDLSLIVLAFRSDHFPLALLYALLSFLRGLAVVYFWLVALTIINWSLESDPLQRVVRLHLGRVSRLPRILLAALPCLVIAFAWISLHPLMVKAGLVSHVQTFGQLVRQGLLLGCAPYLTLKYLLPVVLLAYLIINYIYLGRSPLWDFITATARNILAPFRRMPHRLGKVDFSPVIATVLILVVLEVVPNLVEQRFPHVRHWLWPS